MLRLYSINNILEWKIPNGTDFHNSIAMLSAKYHNFHDLINSQFGSYGLYILALFVFFLFLIIVIYIKSVADTFKAAEKEEENSETPPDGLFYTVDTIDTSAANTANDNQPFEKASTPKGTYNRNIALAEMEQEISKDILAASSENRPVAEDPNQKAKMKNRMKFHAQKENAKIQEIGDSFTLSPRNDPGIISLIINLLSRNVTDRKIAQALFAHYHDLYDEEDLMQTAKSVRDVIGLCNAGKFDYLPQRQHLPPISEMLFSWAEGDYSSLLLLLQSLLNSYVKQADEENGIIKDMTYALAANCSCIMGNIARLNNNELAHNSFELATELAPKNVIAWSRLGDTYMLENAPEKAMIAYQNVLDIADKIIYEAQVAHAYKKIAMYYQARGSFPLIDEYLKNYNAFCESYGLLTPLTEKENIAYETILQNSSRNLQKSIHGLLKN